MKERKKMCHNCFKSLPYWEFFPVNYNSTLLESNNCIDCYFNGFHDKSNMEAVGVDRDDPVFEDGREEHSLKNSYECAFVGNTSYKDICKTYRIKYEEL